MSSSSQWISGKTCMVTGANSGIGRATSAGLARMGARVVMVARDQGRGETARQEIVQQSGAKKEDVDLMLADLSSLQSVRSLAESFLATGRELEVLVNNAGVLLGKRIATRDGLETTFVVNYLSQFLLTLLLLDRLRSSAPSRVVNVSSGAHTAGHINFDDLQGEAHYSGMGSYSESKLAQVLFTSELAKRLNGTSVTVNAVHPGAVATNWGTTSAGAMSFGIRLAHPFMLSPEKGADTVIYLASSPEVAGVSGKYFTKRRAVTPSREALDPAVADRLWNVSLQLTAFTKDPTAP